MLQQSSRWSPANLHHVVHASPPRNAPHLQSARDHAAQFWLGKRAELDCVVDTQRPAIGHLAQPCKMILTASFCVFLFFFFSLLHPPLEGGAGATPQASSASNCAHRSGTRLPNIPFVSTLSLLPVATIDSIEGLLALACFTLFNNLVNPILRI